MNNNFSLIAFAISSALYTQVSVAQTNDQSVETDNNVIEVITVNGDFRQTSLQKTSSAISILTQEEINRRQAQNLEEIIAIAPNVNFSSGSQRARYYQIRGIGERSQFREPINPSVGVIIDGVDLTGVGSVSSMFDVAQTEIFRGPQGTRFGANALAGIINIITNTPSETFEGAVKATVGNYGSKGLGAVVSGPANDDINYRVAVEKYESNGFIDNVYLKRDDTNNRDELSVRGKLAIQAADELTIDVSLMHFDFDNGYDAFSLDNTRETYSDEPGVDTQKTTALAVAFNYSGLDVADLKLLISAADSKLEYGYDEDWAYGQYEWRSDDPTYTPDPCITPTGCLADTDGYSSTDYYFRNKESQTLELRATSKEGQELFNGSTSWVSGVYIKNEKSELARQYTWEDDFSSTFETTTLALYTELFTQLSNDLFLTTGLRLERREADYTDSGALDVMPSDSMVGGKIVLTYQTDDSTMLYGSINRGYKAGGVNTDGSLKDEERIFDAEYLWNYELGFKTSFFDNSAYLRSAIFYMDRDDVQVKISNQVSAVGGFVEYIDNASSGSNIGLEIESGWQVNDNVEIYGSIGLLDTEYKDFSFETEDGTESLSNRDQAHAPSYQFNIGVNYVITDSLLLNISVEGKDGFYFSDSHEEQSDSYELLNASLMYSQDNWNVSLWARNLTDEEYQTRGFFFGNDPRDGYTSKAYYQLGEPAVIGLTANYNF